MKRITVKELLAMDIDVDVCDDVCEDLYIGFVGPQKLTARDELEFAYALNLEVIMPEVDGDCAIVCVDHPEERIWRKNLREAIHLFEACAGYCTGKEYDEWFGTEHKLNPVVEILMERDGLSEEVARQAVRDCKAELQEALWGTSCIPPEEVIEDELGLEPDYIEDVLYYKEERE